MIILDILTSIFGAVWGLMTGVEVPFLGVSFGTFFLAIMVAKLSVSLVSYAFGFGGGSEYRSGSSRNPKISDDRKGDEF